MILLSLSAVICVVGRSEFAVAQDRGAGHKKPGFSQLNFDHPRLNRQQKAVSLEELTADPNILQGTSPVIISNKGNGAPPTSQQLPNFDPSSEAPPTSLLEVTGYLTPHLKGVTTDQQNSSAISSSVKWAEKTGTFCAQAANTLELCNKAKALREILEKFSGNSDFFDSQCTDDCGASNDVSRLVGFKIMDVTKGALRIEGDGQKCNYSLQKATNAQWKMIPVYDPECACLPRNCL